MSCVRTQGKLVARSLEQEIADFVRLLWSCAKSKDLQRGTSVHADIHNRGLLRKDCYLASALVNMYAKCGAFGKAAQVLDELSVRDVITWNSIIAGYAQQEHGGDALKFYAQMQSEGLVPNIVTYICILKACGSIQALDMGKKIHIMIETQGLLDKNVVLGTTLVDMYAKCGLLERSEQVLDRLPLRTIASWNALIAGYCQFTQTGRALACFRQMKQEGLPPNAVTFTCILNALSSIGATDGALEVYDEIVNQGLLDKDVVLGNTLIDLYGKCGALQKAAKVLDELPVRDIVSWNALIAGYAEQGQGEEALKYFEQMQYEGLSPNAITFSCILRACGSIGAAEKGKEIHDEILRQELLGKDIVLGNSLVDMYIQCGAAVKAAHVLDELPNRDVITWGTLIAGYAQQGDGEKALKYLERMQSEGFSPNLVTFVCVLKACGSLGAIDKGKEIHDNIINLGLGRNNILLGNTLVDMYARCGALGKSKRILDELPVRDVISWNALITGYVQEDQGEEALKCFEQMKIENLFPDRVTFLCVLQACGCIGAIDKGEKIHEDLLGQGLLWKDVMLGNTLVDMYAKCGALESAAFVLDKLPIRDVVTWNALITGYAQDGEGKKALDCFECILCEGISPDAITLASMICACSCSGLLDEGQICFTNMSRIFCLRPDEKHYTCMVDLFARSGEFQRALLVLKKMQAVDKLPGWRGLLGACRECGNVKLGRLAFENAVQIVMNDATASVLLSNVYMATGMQEDAVS